MAFFRKAKHGSVAQSVEQQPFKLMVAGSNPARPTIFKSERFEHLRLFSYDQSIFNLIFMYTLGVGVGKGGWFALHLHFVFGLVLLLGLIFFVAWALKSLSKKDLKKLAVWMLVVGVLGTVASAAAGHSAMRSWFKDWDGKGAAMMENADGEEVPAMMEEDVESAVY